MESIKKKSVEDLKAEYKELGFTEARIKKATEVFSSVPKEGRFSSIEKRVYEGNAYPVVVVIDTDDKVVGEIAIGTLRASKVVTDESGKVLTMQISKANKKGYANYFMARSEVYNSFASKSELEMLSELIGKSYKAVGAEETVVLIEMSKKASDLLPMPDGKKQTERAMHIQKTAALAAKQVARKTLYKFNVE